MFTLPAKKDIIRFSLVAAVIIFFDALTKSVMLELIFNPPRVITILPFLNFAPAWNEGVSFGLLAQGGNWTRYGISLLALVVVLWLFFQLPQLYKGQKIAASLISGGAIGNVIDRQIYGKVVDFIDFHLGAWHYPAFNIADSAIFIGVGIWMVSLVVEVRRQKQQDDNQQDTNQNKGDGT